MKNFIKIELNNFLHKRTKIFPAVSEEQKEKWVKNIYNEILDTLNDTDIYYDTKPKDVIESR